MESPKSIMDFETAIAYMDPMQVTDYLHKTLDFLKRNNTELCFPNISPYVEAFLVNLVTDTRNLKSKSFNDEDRRFASEIIDILEMSRDVFRWTHTYENGKLTNNLLVYKKIFSNKIKKKKATKPSTIAHRLIQAQSPNQLPPNQPRQTHDKPAACQYDPPAMSAGFKLAFLNETLRFIKSDAETLFYKEMASHQAEYIQSLFKNPDKDKNIGFGYKSLYAPLWEALDVHGVNFLFDITLHETEKAGTAVLVLKKISRKNSSESTKETATTHNNLNIDAQNVEDISKNTRTRRKRKKKLDQFLNSSTGSTSSARSVNTTQSSKLDLIDKVIDKTTPSLSKLVNKAQNSKASTEVELKAGPKLAPKITDQTTTGCKLKLVSKARTQNTAAISELEHNKAGPKLAPKVTEQTTTGCELKPLKKSSTPTTASSEFELNKASAKLAPKFTDQTTTGSEPELKVDDQFVKKIVVALTEFADDPTLASISFDQLSQDEMCFVKKVKGLAASAASRSMFQPHIGALLSKLNASVNTALKTCRITTTLNERYRCITLKKIPLFTVPAAQPSAVTAGARSKSVVSTKSRDRSLSKDRMIQFQKAGKPATGNVEAAADKDATENKAATDKGERGRSRDRLNKRTAKLLEDMSTPVESDRGIRMMLLMGWDGGALGARGDGIMEPIMPAIELPAGAGLGHVPPPKPPTPRRPADFRLALLHGIFDLLLHDELQKDLQYKEPLTSKELRFITATLKCFNKRRSVGLAGKEAELIGLVLQELAKLPSVTLQTKVSQDLRTLTLMKNILAKPPPLMTKPPPKPLKPLKDIPIPTITITDDEADVLVTRHDIHAAYSEVDTSMIPMPASEKVIRKRAARLVFLHKIAEVLNWEAQEIKFKFKGTMQKRLKAFLIDVVKCINTGGWSPNVFHSEQYLYMEIQKAAQGYTLSLEFKSVSIFILRKTSVFIDSDHHDSPASNVHDNNNDKLTSNQNEINIIKNLCDKDNSQDTIKNNVDSHRLIKAIEIHTQKDKVIENIDRDISTKEKPNVNGRNVVNVEMENVDITIENDNLNAMELDVAVNDDSHNLIRHDDDTKDAIKTNIETECDTIRRQIMNIQIEMDINKNVDRDFEASIRVDAGQSDINRDIEDLEMVILNADIDCNVKNENDVSDRQSGLEKSMLKTELECDVKKENDTQTCLSDLETAISEAALSFNIKKEIDLESSPNSKRSRSNSISSQEIDAKRTKINRDENIVIILPKNGEVITEEAVRTVQTFMSNEIDKAGGFLPLLKCHGVQNGGLIYSCHDNDDVEWLKNVISAANLDLDIVPGDDMCLDKKSRKMVIKINSYIPLDTKATFNKFENYNAGLYTKYWKVISKQTVSAFVLFIVEVDEKSMKYISDENFSLYCGIDKAQFSVIF